MADVGIGINRRLIDSDGDPIDDGAGRLKVSIVGGSTTIASLQNSTVGTSAENLNGGSGTGGSGSAGDSIPCKHIDIMAAVANTGIIYVGGSGVTASTGVALYAGDVYSIDIDDVNNVFVLATVDGENVQFTYYT